MADPIPQTGAALRERILADHAVLRRMLEEVDALAERFEGGDEAVGRTLRKQGFQLYQRLSEHLELEERSLTPRLRAAGDRGRRLAGRLDHEHKEQRELLQYLLGRLGESATPTLLIARELRHFAGYLRLDMEYEETTLLSEDVVGADGTAAS